MSHNPSGVHTRLSSGGSKYYHDGDLRTGDGSSHGSKLTISLKLLAPSNIPLLLDPKHWNNQNQGIFKGQLVTIFCAKEVGSGCLVYRCKYVIQEDEDGKALLIFLK